MRVVITGATGNVGTSLIHALTGEPAVTSIVGLARRRPTLEMPKTTWVKADVSRDELTPHFRGADAVVHLAWVIQPSRDLTTLSAINVEGSARVFGAAAAAGVGALVYASSIGAYSAGPKDRAVDESWPTNGVASSFYSRHKAQVERLLDSFERDHPRIRVVRLRPALMFKRESASEVRRLFLGPFLPNPLLHPRLIPVIPEVDRLRVQVVHSLDAGEAYRLALTKPVTGAFNIAADPIVDAHELARLLRARTVRVAPKVVRAAASATWRLRLQPSPPGWLDLGLAAPVMDTTRARTELGWSPRMSAHEAIMDLVTGLRERAGMETPPLARETGGPLRIRELLTGVGSRSGVRD